LASGRCFALERAEHAIQLAAHDPGVVSIGATGRDLALKHGEMGTWMAATSSPDSGPCFRVSWA
jgi:hypothetical protein